MNTYYRAAARVLTGATAVLVFVCAQAQESGGFMDGLRKIGGAVGDAASKVADGVAAGVKGAADGKGNVRGYVPLQNGQTLTCFEHMPGALIAPGVITNPAQGKGAPLAALTAKGQLVTGECDKLAADGVLLPYLPPSTGAPGSGTPVVAGTSSDGPPVPVFTYTDTEGHIISNAPDNCKIIYVSDANGNLIKKRYVTRPEDYVIASKCDTARYDAISNATKPQAAAAGVTGSGTTGAAESNDAGTWRGSGAATRQALHDSQGVNAQIFAAEDARRAASAAARGNPKDDSAKLSADTTAKFAAIQNQAANAASHPSSGGAPASDEDIADDGAKLCKLKAVQAYKLKDQALQFVRFDKRADKIVMSEYTNGARREVVLDEKGFAQRSASLTQDIGAGGETCGRAFWGNEAIKQAIAAFSGN